MEEQQAKPADTAIPETKTYPIPEIDTRTEKLIQIPNFGPVVIKKYRFKDRCALKGKMIEMDVNSRTGKEIEKINTEALFFWSVVYSVKSLPKHPNFYQLVESQKVEIINNLGEEGELILKEATQYNQLNVIEAKKK